MREAVPVSAQLAAARLLPMAACDIVSIHGRPVGTLVSALAPRARLLVIAQDGKVRQVVPAAVSAGYAASMHVLADLGGEGEARIDGQPTAGSMTAFPIFISLPLHVRMQDRPCRASPRLTAVSRMTAS